MLQQAHYVWDCEKTVQPSQCAARYNVHQLEFEFCIEQFSLISLSYFNNVTISILQASASCDRDLQLLGSLHLLSVQLFSDSESCFHGPSEDTWRFGQCPCYLQFCFFHFSPYFCYLLDFCKEIQADSGKLYIYFFFCSHFRLLIFSYASPEKTLSSQINKN